jgi:hypothetical protein
MPATFTLIIDPDKLRLIQDDDGDSIGTHQFSHTGPAAPGDCQLTPAQLETFVRRAASLLDLRMSRAPR